MTAVIPFLRKHKIYCEHLDWVKREGFQTLREMWESPKVPDHWRVRIATRRGIMLDSDVYRFCHWSLNQFRHLMVDSRVRNALDVAIMDADGVKDWYGFIAAFWSAQEAAEGARREITPIGYCLSQAAVEVLKIRPCPSLYADHVLKWVDQVAWSAGHWFDFKKKQVQHLTPLLRNL